jgi:predicted MFS family arabinose efflux permease
MTPGPEAPARAGGPTGAIFALASSAFTYVTAETLPVGLLPQIAEGLSTSEAATGLLLTIYALIVAGTTIPLAAFALRFGRKRLLVAVVAILAVSQLLSAAAPTFTVLVLARVVCALAHGVFWAALAPAAARLVTPDRLARVMSRVFLGTTAALVVGLPAVTAFGQVFGWRAACVLMAAMGATSCVLLLRLLPTDDPASRGPRRSARAEVVATFGVLRTGAVVTVCLVAISVVIGQFVVYTYFAPLVRESSGLAGAWASVFLLIYGVSGVLGNVLVGPLADRSPGTTLAGAVSLILVAHVTLALVSGPVPVGLAVLAWGLGFPAATVCLQAAVLQADPRAQDAASAVYVVAFQIGISAGALGGERAVTGLGLAALPAVGAVVLVVAVLAVLASPRVFPRRYAPATP